MRIIAHTLYSVKTPPGGSAERFLKRFKFDRMDRPDLTALDIATRLKVSAGVVRHWSMRGQMPPACRFGRCTRWRLSDIERRENTKREKFKQFEERQVRIRDYIRELKRTGRRFPAQAMAYGALQ